MATVKYNRVAVIGAGISGVSAAAHLLKQGVETVLFERSAASGGVWHFDERAALEPLYPSAKPSTGDYFVEKGGKPKPLEDFKLSADLEIAHAPPGPAYYGLKNNVSTRALKTSLQDWPAGTTDYQPRRVLENYIQSISHDHGVHAVTQYHTRVEDVRKDGNVWSVRTTTLQDSPTGKCIVEKHWTFDGVVVCSGHYSMPFVPSWPGITEWKEARPKDVWHSKRYRTPDELKDKNILIIGDGVSAGDIIKESSSIAGKIYQSARGETFGGILRKIMPSRSIRVPGVARFDLDLEKKSPVDRDGTIPGTITLADGQVLRDIHTVIIATGYVTSYPFLSQLHDDDLPASNINDTVLVTKEGEQTHNLHKDIFYIKDPSLAFVGVPYHNSTFSLFDFQAQIIARVFSGKARLPSEAEMRSEYNIRARAKPLGREFHSLKDKGEELQYVKALVDWANQDPSLLGSDGKMHGHTPEFLGAYNDAKEMFDYLLAPEEESKNLEAPALLRTLIEAMTSVSEKPTIPQHVGVTA